jgi:hypothetical protein
MPGNGANEYEVRQAINRVVDASRRLLDTDRRPVQRGQHPKPHGCVRARFVVGQNLGDAYRQGLFQHERVYEAWIRFSNGGQHDDRKPDAHGMAIKLMGVDGPKVLPAERDATTHDFVMVDNSTFFLRDAVEYGVFSDVLKKATGKAPSSVYNVLGFMLSGPARSGATLLLLSLLRWRFSTFLRLIRFAGKRIHSPLSTRYWSTTPYKFGDKCMKFSAVPAAFPDGQSVEGRRGDSYETLADFLRPAVAAGPVATEKTGDSADYLRDRLARELASRGAVFLFQVQFYQDEKTTPIGDPTVTWPEDAAPFHTVARIWIPKQIFDTPGRMAFGENLSFTPWHAIPAHEPLGEINLVRKDVYAQLSDLRHRLNGVTPHEPSLTDPDPVDLPPQWGSDSTAFYRILDDELELIRKRRRRFSDGSVEVRDDRPEPVRGELVAAPARDVDDMTRRTRLRALNEQTTGLAFSGQGARAAAFAVGFLQGLGSLGLMRRFDYLSAVGGGSHAAAWLAAWLKRSGSDPENVERQLATGRIDEARATRQYLAPREVVDPEPQPIFHLRSHARSLFARAGTVAVGDEITITAWARNVIIHFIVLVPLLVLVVVGARLVVALYVLIDHPVQLVENADQFDSRLGNPLWAAAVVALGLMFLAGILALVRGCSAIVQTLRGTRRLDSQSRRESLPIDSDGQVSRQIVTRLLAAALLLSFCLPPIARTVWQRFEMLGTGTIAGGSFWFRTVVDSALASFKVIGWPNFLVHGLIGGGLMAWLTARSSARDDAIRRNAFIGASFAAGVAAGSLVVLLEGLFVACAQLARFDLAATFIPPLALVIGAIALVVQTAVLGSAAGVADRASLADVGGRLTRRAMYSIATMATIVYLPGVVFAASGIAQLAIAVGWLAMGASGVIVGRNVLAGRDANRTRPLMWLASAAAWVFFAGLLGATALFVSLLANMPSMTAPSADDSGPFAYYLQGLLGTSIPTLLGIGLCFGILCYLTRRLIDVNLFSLSTLDADRLTLWYIAASRPIAALHARWSQPRDQRVSTGAPSLAAGTAGPVVASRDAESLIAPDDDFALRELRIGGTGDDDRAYYGPYLLFNTTRAVTEPDAINQRVTGVESFILSPLYCGSQSVGYSRTEDSRPVGGASANLSLCRAAAISGSSGDVRWGSLLPGPVAALFTLFSIRPGSWIEKPKPDGWSAASPRYGDLPVTAALGLADGANDFVYLDDGGQIDRLGAYELLRRRCRYIVAVDGASDAGAADTNFARLIERCRIDFGIRIEIDTSRLNPAGSDRSASMHVTVGQIHYGDVDEGGMPGLLVYIKPALAGAEPLEAMRVASSDDHPFERYRCLGEHSAHAAFGEAVRVTSERFADALHRPHAEFVPELFEALRQTWTGLPSGMVEGTAFAASSRAMTEQARDDAVTAQVAAPECDLEPELTPQSPTGRTRVRAPSLPQADAAKGAR